MKPNQGRPVLIRMADVRPAHVQWLWRPYFPLGKLTLLEGDPGMGKTWLALKVAASVSTGTELPGNIATEPQSVLYLTAEDGLADTLRPRLDRTGADVSRVHVLDGVAYGNRISTFTLADLPVLRASLEQLEPALVVIDPLQAYMGSTVDMYRANEVRPLLSALGKIAEDYECAVCAIRHLRKSSSDRAVHRGMGSIDFAAAARSVLLVSDDPTDDEGRRRILAHVKSSLEQTGVSLAFDVGHGEFSWLGESELSADDLLAPRQKPNSRPGDEAGRMLEKVLSGGPVEVAKLRRLADELGISWRTFERAKKRIGVRSRRLGGLASDGAWAWELRQPNGHPDEIGGLRSSDMDAHSP